MAFFSTTPVQNTRASSLEASRRGVFVLIPRSAFCPPPITSRDHPFSGHRSLTTHPSMQRRWSTEPSMLWMGRDTVHFGWLRHLVHLVFSCGFFLTTTLVNSPWQPMSTSSGANPTDSHSASSTALKPIVDGLTALRMASRPPSFGSSQQQPGGGDAPIESPPPRPTQPTGRRLQLDAVLKGIVRLDVARGVARASIAEEQQRQQHRCTTIMVTADSVCPHLALRFSELLHQVLRSPATTCVVPQRGDAGPEEIRWIDVLWDVVVVMIASSTAAEPPPKTPNTTHATTTAAATTMITTTSSEEGPIPQLHQDECVFDDVVWALQFYGIPFELQPRPPAAPVEPVLMASPLHATTPSTRQPVMREDDEITKTTSAASGGDDEDDALCGISALQPLSMLALYRRATSSAIRIDEGSGGRERQGGEEGGQGERRRRRRRLCVTMACLRPAFALAAASSETAKLFLACAAVWHRTSWQPASPSVSNRGEVARSKRRRSTSPSNTSSSATLFLSRLARCLLLTRAAASSAGGGVAVVGDDIAFVSLCLGLQLPPPERDDEEDEVELDVDKESRRNGMEGAADIDAPWQRGEHEPVLWPYLTSVYRVAYESFLGGVGTTAMMLYSLPLHADLTRQGRTAARYTLSPGQIDAAFGQCAVTPLLCMQRISQFGVLVAAVAGIVPAEGLSDLREEGPATTAAHASRGHVHHRASRQTTERLPSDELSPPTSKSSRPFLRFLRDTSLVASAYGAHSIVARHLQMLLVACCAEGDAPTPRAPSIDGGDGEDSLLLLREVRQSARAATHAMMMAADQRFPAVTNDADDATPPRPLVALLEEWHRRRPPPGDHYPHHDGIAHSPHPNDGGDNDALRPPIAVGMQLTDAGGAAQSSHHQPLGLRVLIAGVAAWMDACRLIVAAERRLRATRPPLAPSTDGSRPALSVGAAFEERCSLRSATLPFSRASARQKLARCVRIAVLALQREKEQHADAVGASSSTESARTRPEATVDDADFGANRLIPWDGNDDNDDDDDDTTTVVALSFSMVSMTVGVASRRRTAGCTPSSLIDDILASSVLAHHPPSSGGLLSAQGVSMPSESKNVRQIWRERCRMWRDVCQVIDMCDAASRRMKLAAIPSGGLSSMTKEAEDSTRRPVMHASRERMQRLTRTTLADGRGGVIKPHQLPSGSRHPDDDDEEVSHWSLVEIEVLRSIVTAHQQRLKTSAAATTTTVVLKEAAESHDVSRRCLGLKSSTVRKTACATEAGRRFFWAKVAEAAAIAEALTKTTGRHAVNNGETNAGGGVWNALKWLTSWASVPSSSSCASEGASDTATASFSSPLSAPLSSTIKRLLLASVISDKAARKKKRDDRDGVSRCPHHHHRSPLWYAALRTTIPCVALSLIARFLVVPRSNSSSSANDMGDEHRPASDGDGDAGEYDTNAPRSDPHNPPFREGGEVEAEADALHLLAELLDCAASTELNHPDDRSPGGEPFSSDSAPGGSAAPPLCDGPSAVKVKAFSAFYADVLFTLVCVAIRRQFSVVEESTRATTTSVAVALARLLAWFVPPSCLRTNRVLSLAPQLPMKNGNIPPPLLTPSYLCLAYCFQYALVPACYWTGPRGGTLTGSQAAISNPWYELLHRCLSCVSQRLLSASQLEQRVHGHSEEDERDSNIVDSAKDRDAALVATATRWTLAPGNHILVACCGTLDDLELPPVTLARRWSTPPAGHPPAAAVPPTFTTMCDAIDVMLNRMVRDHSQVPHAPATLCTTQPQESGATARKTVAVAAAAKISTGSFERFAAPDSYMTTSFLQFSEAANCRDGHGGIAPDVVAAQRKYHQSDVAVAAVGRRWRQLVSQWAPVLRYGGDGSCDATVAASRRPQQDSRLRLLLREVVLVPVISALIVDASPMSFAARFFDVAKGHNSRPGIARGSSGGVAPPWIASPCFLSGRQMKSEWAWNDLSRDERWQCVGFALRHCKALSLIASFAVLPAASATPGAVIPSQEGETSESRLNRDFEAWRRAFAEAICRRLLPLVTAMDWSKPGSAVELTIIGQRAHSQLLLRHRHHGIDFDVVTDAADARCQHHPQASVVSGSVAVWLMVRLYAQTLSPWTRAVVVRLPPAADWRKRATEQCDALDHVVTALEAGKIPNTAYTLWTVATLLYLIAVAVASAGEAEGEGTTGTPTTIAAAEEVATVDQHEDRCPPHSVGWVSEIHRRVTNGALCRCRFLLFHSHAATSFLQRLPNQEGMNVEAGGDSAPDDDDDPPRAAADWSTHVCQGTRSAVGDLVLTIVENEAEDETLLPTTAAAMPWPTTTNSSKATRFLIRYWQRACPLPTDVDAHHGTDDGAAVGVEGAVRAKEDGSDDDGNNGRGTQKGMTAAAARRTTVVTDVMASIREEQLATRALMASQKQVAAQREEVASLAAIRLAETRRKLASSAVAPTAAPCGTHPTGYHHGSQGLASGKTIAPNSLPSSSAASLFKATLLKARNQLDGALRADLHRLGLSSHKVATFADIMLKSIVVAAHAYLDEDTRYDGGDDVKAVSDSKSNNRGGGGIRREDHDADAVAARVAAFFSRHPGRLDVLVETFVTIDWWCLSANRSSAASSSSLVLHTDSVWATLLCVERSVESGGTNKKRRDNNGANRSTNEENEGAERGRSGALTGNDTAKEKTSWFWDDVIADASTRASTDQSGTESGANAPNSSSSSLSPPPSPDVACRTLRSGLWGIILDCFCYVPPAYVVEGIDATTVVLNTDGTMRRDASSVSSLLCRRTAAGPLEDPVDWEAERDNDFEGDGGDRAAYQRILAPASGGVNGAVLHAALELPIGASSTSPAFLRWRRHCVAAQRGVDDLNAQAIDGGAKKEKPSQLPPSDVVSSSQAALANATKRYRLSGRGGDKGGGMRLHDDDNDEDVGILASQPVVLDAAQRHSRRQQRLQRFVEAHAVPLGFIKAQVAQWRTEIVDDGDDEMGHRSHKQALFEWHVVLQQLADRGLITVGRSAGLAVLTILGVAYFHRHARHDKSFAYVRAVSYERLRSMMEEEAHRKAAKRDKLRAQRKAKMARRQEKASAQLEALSKTAVLAENAAAINSSPSSSSCSDAEGRIDAHSGVVEGTADVRGDGEQLVDRKEVELQVGVGLLPVPSSASVQRWGLAPIIKRKQKGGGGGVPFDDDDDDRSAQRQPPELPASEDLWETLGIEANLQRILRERRRQQKRLKTGASKTYVPRQHASRLCDTEGGETERNEINPCVVAPSHIARQWRDGRDARGGDLEGEGRRLGEEQEHHHDDGARLGEEENEGDDDTNSCSTFGTDDDGDRENQAAQSKRRRLAARRKRRKQQPPPPQATEDFVAAAPHSGSLRPSTLAAAHLSKTGSETTSLIREDGPPATAGVSTHQRSVVGDTGWRTLPAHRLSTVLKGSYGRLRPRLRWLLPRLVFGMIFVFMGYLCVTEVLGHFFLGDVRQRRGSISSTETVFDGAFSTATRVPHRRSATGGGRSADPPRSGDGLPTSGRRRK